MMTRNNRGSAAPAAGRNRCGSTARRDASARTNAVPIRPITVGLLLLVLCTSGLFSCGEEKREESRRDPALDKLILAEDLYGFRLGEFKDDLYERSKYRLSWTRIDDRRLAHRGEIYELSGPLDGSRTVDHVRVSFIDGYLWELVVYFKDTGVSTLRNTKRRLEREYGIKPTSPPGDVEKTYKTYRFNLPEMAVVLVRFTKKYDHELYIQYMHRELHERLLEKKQ